MNDLTNIEEKKVFFKFMKEEHLKSFLNEGLLFMNTLGFFKGYEEDEKEYLRGDKDEGLRSTHDADLTAVTWNGVNIPCSGTIKTSYAEVEKINLYCLTAISGKDIISSKNNEFYLPSRFTEFGEKTIFIKRADLFFSRIKKALKEDDNIILFEGNKLGQQVKYFDKKSHHCSLGVFAKSSDYSWQKEWRLAFQRIEGEGAIELRIGNLKDVVEVIDTKEAIKHPMRLESNYS